MIGLYKNKNLNEKAIINSLKSQILLCRIYSIIITSICCLLLIGYIKKNNDSVNEIAEMKINHNNQVIALNTEFEALQKEYDYVFQELSSMSETINSLINISSILDEENSKLKIDNIELLSVIDVYQEREELFNKYEYALYDTAGKRTDITYEQLPTLEKLIEESCIPDTDLILSMVMTESGGKEDAINSKSMAKGFGQFLDPTSKFVYTKLLNKDGWSSAVALDGDTNLQMTVAYMDYLIKFNNYNLVEVIKDYSGGEDISSYVSSMNKYLSKVNKSFDSICLLINNQ